MNTLFLDIIEKYINFKKQMIQSDHYFFSKKENLYFIEKWTCHHLELLKEMSKENFEDLDEMNKKFLEKRTRMVSAFLQGLKRIKTVADEKYDKIWKEIIHSHDDVFKKLLAEILSYYSDELVKIQRYRKVSAAYTQAHLFQGG